MLFIDPDGREFVNPYEGYRKYQKNYRHHFKLVKRMTDERGIFFHKVRLGDHLPNALKAFFDIYNSIGY